MRDSTISEAFALELMREGKLLMRMHTVNGLRWFVVPGGQVADSVAKRILARPDVQPHDGGLFPGHDQTFKLRADWRAATTSRASARNGRARGHQRNRPPNRWRSPMGTRADYGYGESTYLKAEDMAGKSTRVTISDVEDVEFDKGLKPVLSFEGKIKRLVVNLTNFDILAAGIGNRTQDWVGHTIILRGTKTRFKGRMVDSIQVSVPKQAATKNPVPAEEPEAPFDDDIPPSLSA
jgi:hypothetical protein